jgi:hypothetical protein
MRQLAVCTLSYGSYLLQRFNRQSSPEKRRSPQRADDNGAPRQEFSTGLDRLQRL